MAPTRMLASLAVLVVIGPLARGQALPPGVVHRLEFPRLGKPPVLTGVAYSNDGKSLAVGMEVGDFGEPRSFRSVLLFDAQTGKRTRLLSKIGSRFAFAPDGKFLAYGGDELIAVHELGGMNQRAVVRKLPLGVTALAYAPDGKTLTTIASMGFGSNAHSWDLSTGQRAERQFDVPCTALAWSPDGKSLALGDSADCQIHLWDVAAGKVRGTLPIPKREGSPNQVNAVAYSPDGKTLAAGGFHPLLIWDSATGKERWRADDKSWVVSALAFAPDGKSLAVAGSDGKTRRVDALTGKVLGTLAGHKERVSGVAFAPDGRRLTTVGDDGLALIWDLSRGP